MVVDVDEVLAMFMRGFERFLGGHGLEMRIDRFALFQNIYRPGETEHLDLAAGRELFDRFFEADVEHIDPAPGAQEALEALAERASIVVLTNAPGHSRVPARPLAAQARVRLSVGGGHRSRRACRWRAIAAKTRGQAPPSSTTCCRTSIPSPRKRPPSPRFQMVADERLRPLAFAAPDRHARIDEWDELGPAIAAAIGG